MKNFVLLNFRSFVRSAKIFLMGDDYNMDKCLKSFYRLVNYRVLLAVVVDQTFIPGSVDMCARAYSLIVTV